MKRSAAFMAIAALGAAACGSNTSRERPARGTAVEAPPTRPAVPAALTGTFARSLTRAEAHRAGTTASLRRKGVGRWQLEFDGTTMILRASDGGVVVQPFSATERGTLRALAEDPGVSPSIFCEDPRQTGTYRWRRDGGSLTLTPAHDERCPDREAVLSGTWTAP